MALKVLIVTSSVCFDKYSQLISSRTNIEIHGIFTEKYRRSSHEYETRCIRYTMMSDQLQKMSMKMIYLSEPLPESRDSTVWLAMAWSKSWEGVQFVEVDGCDCEM